METVNLILGLGNPGMQYAQTRHNIGFMVVDALQNELNCPLKPDNKFKAEWGKCRYQGHVVYLAKPSTYMNLSGEAAKRLMDFYKLNIHQLLVLVDDVDLSFGQLRFRPCGSAGTHNGLKSLIQVLGSNQFARLRIGVGSPSPEWDLADYVLAPFDKEREQPHLPQLARACSQATLTWLNNGTESAMNQWNNRLPLTP